MPNLSSWGAVSDGTETYSERKPLIAVIPRVNFGKCDVVFEAGLVHVDMVVVFLHDSA